MTLHRDGSHKSLTLLDRLAREAATLTTLERTLADALARGYPHVLLESATALAARHGTSASTVVRLFAKLGYDTYADAQREARDSVTAALPTAGQRAPATLGGKRSLRACLDDALRHDQHNLVATHESLDLEAFEAIVRLVSGSRGRLFVLAQKNSAPVGAWLALHLNMCRSGVQELGGGSVSPTDAMLWIQPQDVLLGGGGVRQPGRATGAAGAAPSAGAHLQRVTLRLLHCRVLPVQRAGVGGGTAAPACSHRGAAAARRVVAGV